MFDKTLCGIDEAGRGPLAGPLVFAGVKLHQNIEGLADSKAISEKKRLLLYSAIKEYGEISIVITPANIIDELGLSQSIKNSLSQIMQEIDTNNFLFDGNSKYGFENLDTMVKADSKIAQVSAASIIAKVTRDKIMVELSEKYPNYNFEKHKGYGSAAHIAAIKKYGYSDIHRRSYKIKALEE